MRRSFTRLAFALLALALALPALAQERGAWAKATPEQRAEKLTSLMKEKLGLSDEQVPKVQAINLDAAKKNQAAMAAGQGRVERMRAMKQVQEEKEAALKGVLTPEQLEKYQAAKEEFRQHARERMREHAAEQPAPAQP
jgi:hypothetical protein